MTLPESSLQRVLIVSSHPLFGEGLRSLLRERQVDFEVVGLVNSVETAIQALEAHRPDVVIVDYDDEKVNREEFMARFVGSEGQVRVVLLSLKEGQEGREAVVYDRRTMAAWQIEEWLEGWTQPAPTPPIPGPQSTPRRTEMRHWIIAGLLVIIVTAGLGFGLTNARLLPEQASAQAVPIDQLFGFHFWAIAFLFALIVVFMVYSVVVFRRRDGDTGDGHYTRGNYRLEVVWTVLPLMAVLGLSFWGADVLAETRRVDPSAMPVNVIAAQWSWRFEYPDQEIVSTELVLPVNRQVLLTLSSQDVIHSFWVPEFRVKQDALPGGKDMERELRVTPTEIGDYKIRCAELCGRLHSEMLAPVSVRSEADFDAWVAENAAAISDVPSERGAVWSQQFGCVACHSADGSPGVGPTWLGVFGEQEILEDGSSLLIDEAYLRESIRNPAAKIVQGFQNVMPANIAEGMTDEQVEDVIEYIKSLSE